MAVVQVGPEIANPTHHVCLSDGKKTVGLILCDSAGNATALAITRAPVPRTALKTTTGNQSYSDFEPPWTPIAQDDWSGGRGLMDFDKDTTRFFDAYRANTMAGNIILGPQEVYTSGYRSNNFSLPGSVGWTALIGETAYLAVKFTATAYTAGTIYLLVKRTGTPTEDLTVELCSDGSGSPGSVLQSVTLSTTTVSDITSELRKLTLTSQALNNGLDYWIKVYSTDGDDKNNWQIGIKESAGTTKESEDGSTWVDSANDLYYMITTADAGSKIKLFQYKRAQYAAITTSSTVKIYMNGDRGAADSNSGTLNKLKDATKSWTNDQWVGCIVQIIEGTGRAESKPWRVITANDATSLTVDDDWTITHDTTTAYVILGANTWTEVTGHGLTTHPTDIKTINNVCYFCQGESIAMRRMRWTASALYAWAADGTNKRDLLETVYDATDGLVIYASENINVRVSKASPQNWGTDLTFSTVFTFQDNYGNITGLAEYGDSSKTLWIMREGAVFYLSSAKALEMPLPEMHNVMEYTNGVANLVHNVYLYFNLGSGIERYYNQTLDDVGPNADEGMPSGRQGAISKLVGYPGKVVAAIDAGDDGYSSIVVDNGSGWHELYRGPYGESIADMQFQTVPGSALDRLWIQVGENIIWLGYPSLTTNPQRDTNYRYTHEATITTGYIYAGLYDVFKFYKSLKLFTEDLEADAQVVDVEYQVDDDTEWTPVINTYTQSPMEEINLVNVLGVTGKRLRYRMRIQTNDNTLTPVIKGAILEAITRVPVKYSFSLPHRTMDNDVDLNGNPDGWNVNDKQNQLDEWATNLTPLTMQCIYTPFHNKTVFIDPETLVPNREHTGGYTAKLTVIEV